MTVQKREGDVPRHSSCPTTNSSCSSSGSPVSERFLNFSRVASHTDGREHRMNAIQTVCLQMDDAG